MESQENNNKYVVIYSSDQEKFDTPHGLYLGEKVPAVENPERTKHIIKSLQESGTNSRRHNEYNRVASIFPLAGQ
jgi:hypothetical protein